MSEKNTIARPYAKALFEIAFREDKLEQWSQFLKQVALITQDPQMIELLHHPDFSLQNSVDLIFEMVTDACPSMKEAIECIGENKRLLFMPQIAELFEDLKRDSQQIMHVTLISSMAIQDDKFEQKIITALKKRFKRDIVLQYEVDETLIGGAIIKAGDRIIDESLRGRLTRLGNILGVEV